ncbi:MAG: hypothetical protein M1818_001458 [Claussenomyces sp. TS43310]|nr:MAG: hypothetical protein M1818_001458 [Claussenomyces sp. TS43310]
MIAPPSPRAHRTLRRLQSAQNLGQDMRNYAQPAPRSQQHKHQQQSLLPSDLSPQLSTPSLYDGQSHVRLRSNSDATRSSGMGVQGSPGKRQQLLTKKVAAGDLDRLVRDGPLDGDVYSALDGIRLKILDQGIKSDGDGMSSLRIYLWLILLNAPLLETDAYLLLIHRGASPAYSKIRNDTFRTLATDPLFRRRVSEASLIRLLNAVAWQLHDSKYETGGASITSEYSKLMYTANSDGSPQVSCGPPGTKSRARAMTLAREGSETGSSETGIYVQGMNVLAAPFLYAARSEAEAFVAFYRFITRECPGYLRGAMDGVHKGLALVDKVLAIVDPKLSLYLIGKGMQAELYAFPSVLTLCACTPPLPEVLRLWDFLFAYGSHLNILCIVAQLLILRNSILSSPSPTKILRSFPPLQAETIKQLALTLIKKLPDDVYAEMLAHAK